MLPAEIGLRFSETKTSTFQTSLLVEVPERLIGGAGRYS